MADALQTGVKRLKERLEDDSDGVAVVVTVDVLKEFQAIAKSDAGIKALVDFAEICVTIAPMIAQPSLGKMATVALGAWTHGKQ